MKYFQSVSVVIGRWLPTRFMREACVHIRIFHYFCKAIKTQRPWAHVSFADLVLIPRKNVDSLAIVLELKFNHDADSTIDQIHRRQYPAKVAQYTGDLLLVGINYDCEKKTHECKIEKLKS